MTSIASMHFERWSLQHLGILIGTGALAFWAVQAGRRAEKPRARQIGAVLAGVQVANTLVYMAYRIIQGAWDLRYDLPMEFCNWALVFSVIALYTWNRTMAEVSYFWIMTGSLQGVVTPDLQVSFPDVYFFVFFINHCGLVISALYLVFGLGLFPSRGSVLRSLGFLLLYVAAASVVNLAVDGNYGYLRNKPAAGSLMDYLGPWPWYIASLHAIAGILFAILYFPFRNAELTRQIPA